MIPVRSFVDDARGRKPFGSAREFRSVEVQLTKDGGFIMPEKLAEERIRRWQNNLVGVVLGRRIPLPVIERIAICGRTAVF